MSILANLFSSNSNKNIEVINGNNYIFDIELDNGTTKVKLKFSAIDELSIIDDLRYFYSYGKLTFAYNKEALEAFEGNTSDITGSNSQSVKPYIFRGDGRDFLNVEIMPQMKDSDCLEVGASEAEREKYCIKHNFCIYHFTDSTDGAGFKRRTLYFWDRDFQYMSNIQLDFSTDMLVREYNRESISVNSADVNITGSTQNNSVYTGEAIKGLLEYTLQENYGVSLKFGDWDQGASKINYTTPAQFRAVDDLDFLVTYHVSTDDNENLPAILKKLRYTDKYQLWPINYYYDVSKQKSSSIMEGLLGGNSKTEDFFIGKLNAGEGDSMTSNTTRGVATDYTVIDNYDFVKVSPKELQEFFTTYAVHTNDPRGNFRTDIKPNNYQTIKEKYNKFLVQPNKPTSALVTGSPVSNLPDNIIRETHKNTKHVFVPYALEEKQRKSFGINRTLLNMFFKNTSITFKARGNSARQAGRLITINRRDNEVMPTHDSNLLGQYLITYLRHEFKSGTYANTIVGTKPYTTMNPGFANLP